MKTGSDEENLKKMEEAVERGGSLAEPADFSFVFKNFPLINEGLWFLDF